MALINTYLKLFTSQHRGKSKLKSWAEQLFKGSDDICAVAVCLDNDFDLDLSEGVQLDVLGKLAGINRTVSFQPERGLSPVLDDAVYRTLIRAKIAQNLWKGDIASIKEIWKNLFGEDIVIEDNQDMTMNVTLFGIKDEMTRQLVKNGYIIPKPQSVRLNIQYAEKPVFAYDCATPTLKGYDLATWLELDELPASFAYDLEEEKLNGYDQGSFL
ncbi:MAG: DUF2612 domain-containing protein [bacterium]